jgi:predicted enzyme related to lactoylglutathione lyase
MTTRHEPGTFCWFECATRDVAAAKRFYTQLFGWNAVDMPMPAGQPGFYTLLKLGTDDVAGMYPMDGPMFDGVPPNWTTYVTVTDVDDIARRAESLGATIVAPPMDIENIGRFAFFADPTGANIAVFKPGGHHGTVKRGPVHGTFGWSELMTRDTRAAKAFYTELFNWRTKADKNEPYTEFQVGSQSIGGMLEMKPEMQGVPPHWMPYVCVDNCNAIADQVKKLGGTLIVPPQDIPNVGRFSVFSDPSGAALAVIQLTS